MKYCLSSRNEKKYLELADEIKVQYRDRRIIPDLFEKYPNANIILHIFHEDIQTEESWREVYKYHVLGQGRFICCVSNFEIAYMCKEDNIKFYYGYPIKTYYELKAAIDYGVCYVRLGEPLFFDMDRVKEFGVPVRAVPNIAYNDGFPREHGIYGTWIRPEDVEIYEPYIDVFEFEDCNLKKERGLYRLYSQSKKWSGPLELVISNFNHSGINRMVVPDLAYKRLNCKHMCQSGGSCRACYRAILLANPEEMQEYMDFTDDF